MIRLLIVDDEPYTVDGLYEMLSEASELELEIFRAYSADEAMQRLVRTKVDIVLCDIRMPGMNGIDLQQWIHDRWPRSKVIFLTGIRDFEYAQQALRGGGIDYILKTEGDEAILRSIANALQQLEEESRNEQFLLRAKDQVLQSIPILQKEWFFGLFDLRNESINRKVQRFKELEIRLCSERPVLLVAGRVDRWKEDFTLSNQMLLSYAVQNIAVEYLERVLILPIILEGSYFVWLIQSKQEDENWEEVITFVLLTLESIQSTCKSLLDLPVSLVCKGSPVPWDEVPEVYKDLKQTMILGLGNGEEMLITHREAESQVVHSEPSYHILADLERRLELGQESEFILTLEELFRQLPNRFGIYAQTYYSVALLLLGQINKWDQVKSTIARYEVDQLLNLTGHKSKEVALQYLKETAAELFSRRIQSLDERTHRIIHKLNLHIQEHLGKDLSLDALADVVYLNSSYLSSLYKQYTGKNISDYIAELRVNKAKGQLMRSHLKIHEIAVEVGFGTAGYFTRFFKKHVGVTPQEFRSANEGE